jgi:hypothetical protein
MIAVHFADYNQPARLVEACLIAAGLIPPPKEPAERDAFRALADDLGDGLDRMPRREVPDVPA